MISALPKLTTIGERETTWESALPKLVTIQSLMFSQRAAGSENIANTSAMGQSSKKAHPSSVRD
jgi:hypothetical protein